MGSATAEESSENSADSPLQMQRPLFYSCPQCGLKFTKRALDIHKRQCTESENCSCPVCKISKTKISKEQCILRETEQSGSKKLKPSEKLDHLVNDSLQPTEPHIENGVELTSPSTVVSEGQSSAVLIENNNPETTPNSVVSINSLNTNMGQVICIVNNDSSNGIGTNTVEISSDNFFFDKIKNRVAYIVKKRELRLPDGKKLERKIEEKNDASKTNGEESVDDPLHINEDSSSTIGDEKYDDNGLLKLPSESIDRFHGDQICSRKIFCVICGDHILWKEFTMHILGHCVKIEHKNFRCPLCSDNRSSATYFLMHFYTHISTHPPECEECKCSHPSCLDEDEAPLTEHCYAESMEHRCYVCLR